jgi:hypothetical protein
MADSSPPANTTTTTELPEWAQPFAQEFLTRGVQLSNQQMPVYGGPRSADMNQYQQAGMDMVRQRAMNGSPEMQSGSQQVMKTANGAYAGYSPGQNGYMGDNPYLQAMIDKSAGDITRNYQGATNNTDATFARSGAFGGSAWQQAQEGNQRQLAQGLADSSNGLRYQNYTQSAQLAENGLNRSQSAYEGERGRQLSAAGMAPTFGNQAYIDAQHLGEAGNQQYAYDQQKITDGVNQFNEQAQSPYKQLDVLGNSIRGAVGGGGTTSQSAPGANPYAQAAGGAATAAGLYGLLK